MPKKRTVAKSASSPEPTEAAEVLVAPDAKSSAVKAKTTKTTKTTKAKAAAPEAKPTEEPPVEFKPAFREHSQHLMPPFEDTPQPRKNSKVHEFAMSTVAAVSKMRKSIENAVREDSEDQVQGAMLGTPSSSSLVVPQIKKRRPYFRKSAHFHPYTILDSPEWSGSLFYGFYVLFWVVVTMINLRILLINYLATGILLQTHIIDTLLCDLWHVALADLFMYFMMYPTYLFQKLVAAGVVNWERWGWIAQHLYQLLFLTFFVAYARYVDFPWIGRIFLALHALVQMMKMHSFAVFNGYMKSLADRVESIQAGAEITDSPQHRIDEEMRQELRQELSEYPKNLTLKNFFMFTMFPTVVYEVEYPRTEKIRWSFAFKKIAATFGIFICMIVIAQQFLYPVVVHANLVRTNESLGNRMKLYPLIFLEVFPPFILIYILTFYIIWDAILNSLAELTMYGDREFYRDWWNSHEWAKFARDWNVPVHNFLQRHVYSSSRLALRLSKMQAMFLTFFISATVHELAMWVIFGRIRGYLLLMQLLQLPMQFLSQLPFLKRRPTLGLVMYWFGMAMGPAILTSLYLTF